VAPAPAPAPAPVAAPAPAPGFVLEDEPDDVELIEEAPVEPTEGAEKKTRKSKRANREEPEDKPRKSRKAQAGGGSSRVLLLAGGGLLLVVGAVVAGFVFAGGKNKQKETVQEKQEPKDQDPKPPVVKPPVDDPRPKDKNPPPKEQPTDPVVPPPPPVDPVVPAGRPGLTERWKADLVGARAFDPPVCSNDGRTVVLRESAGKWAVSSYDLEKGTILEPLPGGAERTGPMVAMEGGLFTCSAIRVPALTGWDPRTGKLTKTVDMAGLVVPGTAYISPTGKYVASSGTVEGKEVLRLKSTDPDKIILDMPWANGAVFFTDDEARVLVAEATGLCRWYKLPTGEADRQWTLEKKGPDQSPKYGVKAVSGNGSTVVFWGSFRDKPVGVYVLDGTGRLLASVPNATQAPTVSRDGRFVLVHFHGNDKPDLTTVLDIPAKRPLVEFRAPAEFPHSQPVLFPDGSGCVAIAFNDTRSVLVRYQFPPPKAPPEPPPVSPAPEDPLALKPRWTAETPEYFHYPYLPSAVKSVFVSSGQGTGAAFALETGAPVEQGGDLLKGRVAALYRLNDGQVGRWEWVGPVRKPVIELRDERTGKLAGKLDVPDLPGGAVSLPVLTVSRDARYVASGYERQQVKAESDLPLRVFDLQTNKEVVSRNWTGGRCFFTADSSRVLVAEHNGQGRWYKLPSGEPDGEWDLGFPAANRHLVEYASDDGSVLGYFGPLDRKQGLLAATLDGKTGAVLHRFTEGGFQHIKAVSADGRRVIVGRLGNRSRGTVYEAADARTGAVAARIYLAPDQLNNQIALSPDGTTLALTVQVPKPSVRVYDLPALEPLPAAVARLPVRWTENKANMKGEICLDADGGTIAIVPPTEPGKPWGFHTYDARTGAAGPNSFGYRGQCARVFPLTGWKFGFQKEADKQVTVWKPGLTSTYPLTLPEGTGTPTVNMSPDARYYAIGTPAHKPGEDKPFVKTPLRVFDRQTGKDVVTIDWYVGTTVFTPDSSRILVVDDAGKFRWFKLPDGKPDGEWDLRWKPTGSNTRNLSVSADGSAILFFNWQGQGAKQAHTLLNGKTGAVLHSFPVNRYDGMYGCVSDDGKSVVLISSAEADPGRTIEVLDVRGKAIVSGKHPMDAGSELSAVRANWKTRTLLIQENNQKLTVYDLPEQGGTAAVAPKALDPKGPELPELKQKWSVECTTKLKDASAFFTDDGQTVALVTTTGPLSASSFASRTGDSLKTIQPQTGRGQFHRLCTLEKGRLAFQTETEKELLVWDPVKGGTSLIPFSVPASAGGVPSVNVSPNGRYLSLGFPPPAPGAKDPVESPSIRVQDDLNKNKPTFIGGHQGGTAFTPDGSRLLVVVDDIGQFRWIKLPGLTPEDIWSFKRSQNGHLLGISAHGEVILYHGRPPDKDEAVHLLNGKDGTVLQSFPLKQYLPDRGSVSDDGKYVMLLTSASSSVGSRAEVLDANGKPLAAVKLPAGNGAEPVAAVSWKARILVTYDRSSRRLTGYDLSAVLAP
jgi:hypothetical protein